MPEQKTLEDLLKQPEKFEDLEIPQSVLLDIILRLLYNEGNVNFRRISQVIRVPNVLLRMMDWLRKEHLVEASQPNTPTGPLAYSYKLTGAGEERARDSMERCQYVGPAPVALQHYNRSVELQTSGPRRVSMDQVREALSDMVLPDDFHRRIGPAVNSGNSLFLYGPSGNGKTTIALGIGSLITGTDPIWMPYALTAGGQIIQLYDRLFHKAIEKPTSETLDGRWGLFKRPSVVVGGELKMEMLDLRVDSIAKIYEAPLQLKANGGMFLIDDFGRQQVSPVDLLNRWIVPLENSVDYLRLRTGQTIVVPFRALLIFSTNLNPYKLADDAFYRRIQMKVGVFSPSEERFKEIFVKICSQTNIPFDEACFNYMLERWYHQPGRSLQAVHPRDILKIIQALCHYEGIPAQMRQDLVDEACVSYFVEQ